ncbi:MAG: V-type ATP synthase subunit A [Spirochaetales bacterium]|jgi:V/A-type H+-transporting ATPase subunit A|nr:V-type ATP synthase subunit A [Spirochaetales bacterium]
MIEGKIVKINGPIIQAQGLSSCGLYDVVEAGETKLIGEIIRLEGDTATIQIYEDNTGMRIGEKVVSEERPLSVYLGPGLIGCIYDGIQRPLKNLYDLSGAGLKAGVKAAALDLEKKWNWKPMVKSGDRVTRKTVLGCIQETELLSHRIFLPPDIEDEEELAFVAPEGEYTVEQIIAKTSGGRDIRLAHYWPVRKPRPYAEKLGMSEPLLTGQRVIDVFFPLSKGGTAAIPGGFGTGKTMTQHAVAKWCDADIIVYIGCGERGNEMTDVLREFPEIRDPRTGRSLMERTILIANTSNMPVAAREVSIYTGVTLAEYYRDMGYGVAIMADSTSRWAEALRELSGRLEEMPAEEGFPAYLPTRLAEFYERGGRVTTLEGKTGSISIIGAVSPPGGDFSEPVTQHTKRFIRCFWALDRDLANARHYPAISWIDSYSEYSEELRDWWEQVNPQWHGARTQAMELLKREERLAQIVKLIGPDALPDTQRLILLTADMIRNGFLQQNAFDDIDMYSSPEKQVLILKIIMDFYHRALDIIKAGAPLLKIRELSSLNVIVRIKSQVENSAIEGIREIESRMNGELDKLEKEYRK